MTQPSAHRFIRACFRQPVDRTPVWMMRQAGRYMPEYMAIRKQHDFITMYKTPELATEVTLQPIDILGVDAAILFSDILVVPEAMGMELQFIKGRGPVFPSPLTGEADLKTLRTENIREPLSYVTDAVTMLRRELDGRVPLIGFSGAPWTLATYMIQGSGSKSFDLAKKWRFGRPDLLHNLLDVLSDAIIDYCKAQIEAGAEAIQIFDSWAGLLDPAGFREFAVAYVQRIIEAIRTPGIPIIYFAKGAMVWPEALRESGADVLGVDWTVDLGAMRRTFGDAMALQGNLDPTALYAGPDNIRQMVRAMLDSYGDGSGHIANLGHGILPDIPVPHAQAFVTAVQEESRRYHPSTTAA